VKRLLGVMLGVMTAIGGFVDISNLVTSGVTGARFGTSLTWAVVLGTVAMIVYGEMAGRIASVARRSVFHIVRERLGARLAMVNLVGSFALNLLTVAAEIGGVALAIELATGVNYLLFVPVVGLLAWVVIWRAPFSLMDNVVGLLGLTLLVFVGALFATHAHWADLAHSAVRPVVPPSESHLTWWFYAVSLYGSCVVPYQAYFFSSGGLEEDNDLLAMRVNTFVGFPLGGVLSIAIMWAAAVVLQPWQINATNLGEIGLPAAVAYGKVGIAFAIVGFVAATFGACLEAALSTGYMLAQYFGWPWGKRLRPSQAPEFHVATMIVLLAGTMLVLTTIDPIQLTLVSVVLSAVAIPLTYFPILVVANDQAYLGEKANGPVRNLLGGLLLVAIVLAALAALPLLLLTKSGQ
jgi:Mn2+/Fe2+ NRAMP family transporter